MIKKQTIKQFYRNKYILYHKQIQHFAQLSQFDAQKDYYKTLNVSKTATDKEIKSAFYKLAKQYHPDVYKGDDNKIKEVNEAYGVIGDKQKRQDYDAVRNQSSMGSSPFGRGQQGGARNNQYSQQYQYQYPGKGQQQNYNYQYYWERPGYNGNQNQSYYYQQDRNFRNNSQQGFDPSYMDHAFKDFINQAFQRRQQEQQRMYQNYYKEQNFNNSGYNTGYQNQYKQRQQQYQQNFANQYYQQQQQQNRGFQNQSSYTNFNDPQDFDFKKWQEQNDAAFRVYQEKLRQKKQEEYQKQQEYEKWRRDKEDQFVKDVADKVNKIKDGVEKVSNGVNKAKNVFKSFFKK